MTTRTLVLTALLLCASASPAAAKGISEVVICGADGCRDVTKDAGYAMHEGGSAARPPAAGQPWFDVRVAVRHSDVAVDRWTMRWVPGAKVLRGADRRWIVPSAAAQADLLRLSRGMKPRGVKAEEDGAGGPPALAIAAPAALLLLGGGALARRRRRRHE